MTIKSSDLDFASIKESLIDHFRKYDEYRDYDFEASGLSSIMDVLAYNTHINGLIANMAINESFLSSAQLRSSAVAHAETLGYTPSSRVGANARLTLSTPTTDAQHTLPKGHMVMGDVDGVAFKFTTAADHYVTRTEDGKDFYDNVMVYEGVTRTKTFLANEGESVYVIPDQNLDVNSMVVQVFESFDSTNGDIVYQNINDVSRVSYDSHVYMVKEIANGYYEVFFSDGNVLGQRPSAGNKIVVTYRSTRGSEANGADTWTSGPLSTGQTAPLLMAVEQGTLSGGGLEREGILSIKKLAPKKFTTQNRLVTADDYAAQILANYSADIQNVSVWGGHDNVPPVYGKVFVSIDYNDGVDESRQSLVQDSIQTELTDNLSIMSIDTEFVVPAITQLELRTYFNLDPTTKVGTPEENESQVSQFIEDWVKENLGTFGKTFRRSNLLSSIDDIHPSILNSRMDVKLNTFVVVTSSVNNPLSYTANLPVQIGTPDKDTYTITSSQFGFNKKVAVIKNKLGSNVLQVLDMDNNVLVPNIGTYDSAKGTINITSFYTDELFAIIKLTAVPANPSTLRPLRNHIFELDTTLSTVTAVIDDGNIKVSL